MENRMALLKAWMFKEKLDSYLCRVPDEPKIEGLILGD